MTPSSTPAKTNPPPLRWGLLATGGIAHTFARGVQASQTGAVVAVGSRTAASARHFAAEHGIPETRAYGSYEALLADPEVDAVYISTPHPMHAEWTIKAARAGKHILCEKPLAMNHAEARAMVDAARQSGVLLMEAFMYRCHPQTARVVELIRSGALGEVKLVQASFGFRGEYNPQSRLWAKELGGGAILDVGCYTVSMARLVAGAASGKAFADPVRVAGSVIIDPVSGIDVCAAATLEFPDGVIGQVSCSFNVTLENVVRIHGTQASLLIPVPWVIHPDGGVSEIILHRTGHDPEVIRSTAGPLYAVEADAFATAVRSGQLDAPPMPTDDSLGNAAALDKWIRERLFERNLKLEI